MSETLHKTEPESTGYLLHVSTCRQRLKNSKGEPEWGKAAQWMPRASKVRNDSEQQEGIGGRHRKIYNHSCCYTTVYIVQDLTNCTVKNQQKLLHANHTSIKLICFSRACTRQWERENVASCPIRPIPRQPTPALTVRSSMYLTSEGDCFWRQSSNGMFKLELLSS